MYVCMYVSTSRSFKKVHNLLSNKDWAIFLRMKRFLINMHWMWFWEKGHSKQMINSQMGKAEFSQRSKSRSKQTCVVIPFVLTYRLKLKKIAVYGNCKLWKCWNTCYIRMDLLREYVLLHQWFRTTVQKNLNIWFVLRFTL